MIDNRHNKYMEQNEINTKLSNPIMTTSKFLISFLHQITRYFYKAVHKGLTVKWGPAARVGAPAPLISRVYNGSLVYSLVALNRV